MVPRWSPAISSTSLALYLALSLCSVLPHSHAFLKPAVSISHQPAVPLHSSEPCGASVHFVNNNNTFSKGLLIHD